jgi:replicative DNA helicase
LTRTLPQSPEAEAAVLSGMLLSPKKAIPRASGILDAADFYAPGHAELWRSILEVQKSGVVPDLITLEPVLRKSGALNMLGGMVGLAELARKSATAENIGAHARLVKDAAVRRSLIALGEDVATSSMSSIDSEVVLQGALAKLKGLLDGKQGGRDAREVADSVIKRWQARRRNPTAPIGIATGIQCLDEALECHGFPLGVLFVVAGDTSLGKTSLLKQAGLHAALYGKRVDIVSLEDKAERVFTRMVAELGELQNRMLQAGDLPDTSWKDAVGAAAKIGNMGDRLHFWGPHDGGVDKLCSRILARQRAHGTDLVIWDYLQKTRGGQGKSQFDKLTYNLQAIDHLSQEMPETATVLVSQFKRRDDTTPPRLTDLRGSGEIEQDARGVLYVWTHPSLKREPGRQLLLLKQSDAPPANLYVKWDGDHVRFLDATPAEVETFKAQLRDATGKNR